MEIRTQRIFAAVLLVVLVGAGYMLRGGAVSAPSLPAAKPPAVQGNEQKLAETAQKPATQPPPGSAQKPENLAWPSEDMTSSKYQLNNATMAVAKVDPPAGIGTANLLTETTASGLHRAEIIVQGLTPGAVHTTSLFVKPAERTSIIVEMRDNVMGKYGVARFNAKNGQVLLKGRDVVDAGVIPSTNGWVRVWAAMPYDTDRAVIDLTLMDEKDSTSYDGDGKSGLLLSGFQVNPGDRPTAYVATTLGPVLP